MQISVETVIAADRARVWKAFDDPGNLELWQPTLKSREIVSGVAGQAGCRLRLTYMENGHEIVMEGRISERRAPELLCAEYETAVAHQSVEHIFSPLDGGSTRWRTTSNIRFKKLIPRLMSRCLRLTIARRMSGDMQRFGSMVEADVRTDRAA